jgi:fermentation-respiration switch protein FrsA (DUF1100 family)
MNRHYFIAVAVAIFLIGCNPSSPERSVEKQSERISSEEPRITPDIVYGHKFGMALTFDLFQPQKQNGAGIIFVNSGGFHSPRFPDFYKETAEGLRLTTVQERAQKQPEFQGRPRIKPLLDKGFSVFNVRHGDIDKFTLPEIVSDMRRAVRFIRFHAEKYGIDGERLGVWGGSAGGHLALMIGTTAEIGNSEVTEELEKATGRVAAAVAYFPPTNLKSMVDSVRKNNPEFLKENPSLDMSDELLLGLSPINYVSPDDAPTLIVHGDQDQEVPISQGKSMYQELLKAGVQSNFVTVPGVGHGFIGKDDDFAMQETISWFEEHL